MQAEDLAFDSEIMCDMCSESVNYGADYVAHLNIVHNINKNYDFFLNMAKEVMKTGQRKEAMKAMKASFKEAMKGEQKREADVIRKNFRGLSPKRVHQLPQKNDNKFPSKTTPKPSQPQRI